MKRIIALCAASLIFQSNNCASSSEAPAPKIPSEISGFVSIRYQDSLIKLFNSFKDPKHTSGAFQRRDVSQVYIAFLNDGPINVMTTFPGLLEYTDRLQQQITIDTSPDISALMRAASLPDNKNRKFWESFHSSVRTCLAKRVRGITLYPTDAETMINNTIIS